MHVQARQIQKAPGVEAEEDRGTLQVALQGARRGLDCIKMH